MTVNSPGGELPESAAKAESLALQPPVSHFLPPEFGTGSALTLIAGSGRYPSLIRERALKQGVPLRLLAFDGETGEELWESFAPRDRGRVKVGQVGKAVAALKRLGAPFALMAGKITPGRLFKGLHPDIRALQILANLKERNAETLFGAVVREIEKAGIQIVDARSFMEEDLATEGLMTRGHSKIASTALEHGIRIAKEIARLDIGQGVVVDNGTVLAVEAFEGTSRMLERAGTFGAKEALFVKTTKPGHDMRFDVPVFGLETIEVMRRAGLKAAALEVERALILDRERVIAEAERLGIGLYGYHAEA